MHKLEKNYNIHPVWNITYKNRLLRHLIFAEQEATKAEQARARRKYLGSHCDGSGVGILLFRRETEKQNASECKMKVHLCKYNALQGKLSSALQVIKAEAVWVWWSFIVRCCVGLHRVTYSTYLVVAVYSTFHWRSEFKCFLLVLVQENNRNKYGSHITVRENGPSGETWDCITSMLL